MECLENVLADLVATRANAGAEKSPKVLKASLAGQKGMDQSFRNAKRCTPPTSMRGPEGPAFLVENEKRQTIRRFNREENTQLRCHAAISFRRCVPRRFGDRATVHLSQEMDLTFWNKRRAKFLAHRFT